MIFLRSAAYAVFFYAVTIALVLPTPLVLMLDAGRRRRVAWRIAHLWAVLLLWAARVLCGIRFSVSGIEHVPRDGPALIASRHQSAFDTFVWFTLVPRCTYVMKQELRRVPGFGALTGAAGMIAIDRTAGAAALRYLLREADRAMEAGRQIVIFPEGTRAPAEGPPLPLQPGVAALAARTGLPVIPVRTDSGRLWGRRAFLKRPGTIRIEVLPPLPAGLSRAELLGRLETVFSQRIEETAVDNSVG